MSTAIAIAIGPAAESPPVLAFSLSDEGLLPLVNGATAGLRPADGESDGEAAGGGVKGGLAAVVDGDGED